MTRLFSKCAGCGTFEYNDLLEQRDRKCGTCCRPVRLFVPKSKTRSQSPRRVTFEDPAGKGRDGRGPKSILKTQPVGMG
eukprot:7829110-Pyramimonas_sp.AAC.1